MRPRKTVQQLPEKLRLEHDPAYLNGPPGPDPRTSAPWTFSGAPERQSSSGSLRAVDVEGREAIRQSERQLQDGHCR
jgi:hypothetical protein